MIKGGGVGHVEATLEDLTGLSYDQLEVSDLRNEMRRGTMSEHGFFEELARRHPEAKQIVPGDHLRRDDLFEPVPEMYEIAERLREKGIVTGILSNIFADNAASIRDQGLYDNFDPVLLSNEIHFIKPEVEIYTFALDKLSLKPEKVVFIDDQASYLAPAADLGMHTIQDLSTEQTINDLSRLIEEQNGFTL